jgi:hypothetical protein
LNTIKIKSIAGEKIIISKKKIPNIISLLKNCLLDFEFPSFYEDREFQLQAPKYLFAVSYGVGANSFYYSFNDSEATGSIATSIVVYYDFDGSSRQFFFNQINSKKQKVTIRKFGSKSMYLYIDWQQNVCGKLFLDRNTYLFYKTANLKLEQQLQNAILTFKWK